MCNTCTDNTIWRQKWRRINSSFLYHLSRPMGKPTICIGENKGADQLRSSCEADQRLCFRYSDSTIPLLEETVGREIFRFAQHPPHTRFDDMGGFFDQYKELLGTLSPCDMVHLSSRSRYVCYPFKPEMCSKFVKYTMNL